MAHADWLRLLRAGKQILNPLVRPNIPAGATETAFYRKFRHKARGRLGRVLAMRARGASNTDIRCRNRLRKSEHRIFPPIPINAAAVAAHRNPERELMS